MTQTDNLALPYIAASQAQKHVTHNEAIRKLDALVHLSVLQKDLTAPPSSPAKGARYLVAASATGDWQGKDNRIAAWQDGAWVFYQPKDGWCVWIEAEKRLYAWQTDKWEIAGSNHTNHQILDHVGVNATADDTNRLAISSPASLFNHQGNGHQLKINKQAVGDTASLLYQTNWSGRAEMGLVGNDDFAIKTSPDGSTWKETLRIFKDSGQAFIKSIKPCARLRFDFNTQYGVSAGTRFDFNQAIWDKDSPSGFGGITSGADQGAYRCPYNGIYLIIASVQTAYNSVPFRSEVLRKTYVIRSMYHGNNTAPSGYGTNTACEPVLSYCNAGDLISMRVDARDSGAVVWSANTYLEVVMLAATA